MDCCPKCKGKKFCKDGIVQKRQRYLCKDCQYRFTVDRVGKPDELKRNALILYLEGLGFRSIGRYLKVSHVSVFNWIKDFGENLDEIRSSEKIDVVEIDEMHTYVGEKKTMLGSGLLLIETGKNLSTARLVLVVPKQEKNFGKR